MMIRKIVVSSFFAVFLFIIVLPYPFARALSFNDPLHSNYKHQSTTPEPIQTKPNSFGFIPQQAQPTKIRPTPTPLKIPPPADPRMSRLIIGFGIISVVIVIFGIWINRHKVFKPPQIL